MAITDLVRSAVVGASGEARIEIRPTNRRTWVVSQIAVELSTFTSGASCIIRKGAFPITPVILDPDTAAGTAAGYPAVTLLPNDSLFVDFAGVTAGVTVKALAIYDDGT